MNRTFIGTGKARAEEWMVVAKVKGGGKPSCAKREAQVTRIHLGVWVYVCSHANRMADTFWLNNTGL